jgi:hypothetical protein
MRCASLVMSIDDLSLEDTPIAMRCCYNVLVILSSGPMDNAGGVFEPLTVPVVAASNVELRSATISYEETDPAWTRPSL